MLRLSLRCFASAKFSPHSEQLKLWCAQLQTEPKSATLARNYVNDLVSSPTGDKGLQGVLDDLEDGLELLSILPKIDYPSSGLLMQHLQAHLSSHIDSLTPPQLERLFGEFLQQRQQQMRRGSLSAGKDPFTLFASVTMGQTNIIQKIEATLRALPPREVVRMTSLLWLSHADGRSSHRGGTPSGNEALTSALTKELCKGLARATTAEHDALLLQLAELNAPLWQPELQSQGALALVKKMSTTASMETLESVLKALLELRSVENTEWIRATSTILIQKYASLKVTEEPTQVRLVSLLETLTLLEQPACLATAKFLAALCQVIQNTKSDGLLLCVCMVLHRLHASKVSGDACAIQKIEKSLLAVTVRRVESDYVKFRKTLASAKPPSTNAHEQLFHRLQCESFLKPIKTKNEFSTLFGLTKSDRKRRIPTVDTLGELTSVCKTLTQIQYYPKDLVTHFLQLLQNPADGVSENMTVDDASYIVYVALRAGCADKVVPAVIRAALGGQRTRAFRVSGKRFITNRNTEETATGQSGDTPSVESIHRQRLLVLIFIAQSDLQLNWVEDSESRVKLLLAAAKFGRLDYFYMMRHMTSVGGNNASATSKRLVLSSALRQTPVPSLTTDELQLVLTTLTDVGHRDAVTFVSAIDALKKKTLTFDHVVCAAKVANALHLETPFEEAQLLQYVKTLEGVSFSDLSQLLRCCTGAQRKYIRELPGAAQCLATFDDEHCTVVDLFLLLGMKERATKEGQQWCARVLALMKARPDAMAEGDLSCEVVTSFLEELSPLQEIHPEAPEILFRCCRAVIAQAEVSQLMRLYRVVSQLPKVPFLLFRILGKCVMRGASQMPADHALLWLELYVHQNIRDDGVAKVLLKRVTDGAATALDVKTLDARVRKCAVFFGQSSQFQKVKQKAASTNKKKKKKVISYDYSNFV